ncbi:MAG: hypothetical protein HC802_18000 [Caldilineaceae bacterium]|nr:hypothetical protein [Caldilineaceae bacterium]
MTIIGATIFSNTAADDGGGLFVNGGDVLLEESTLQGNVALQSGGAVRTVAGTLSVVRSLVISNVVLGASATGGGIDNRGAATVAESTFQSNQAWRGAAIHQS